MTNPATARCGGCIHFVDDGAAIEAAFPGLSALSSGYASVRFDDGLCTRHEIYLPATATCPAFTPSH